MIPILEAATKFYENVYGFRQVKTGRSRGHISRHMTDGYIDLALMVYDSEDDPDLGSRDEVLRKRLRIPAGQDRALARAYLAAHDRWLYRSRANGLRQRG